MRRGGGGRNFSSRGERERKEKAKIMRNREGEEERAEELGIELKQHHVNIDMLDKSFTENFYMLLYPTTNGGMQNGSAVEIRTHCTHAFARLAFVCLVGAY